MIRLSASLCTQVRHADHLFARREICKLLCWLSTFRPPKVILLALQLMSGQQSIRHYMACANFLLLSMVMSFYSHVPHKPEAYSFTKLPMALEFNEEMAKKWISLAGSTSY